jgi:hypothetical protein
MILPNLISNKNDWKNSDDKNLLLSKDKRFMQPRLEGLLFYPVAALGILYFFGYFWDELIRFFVCFELKDDKSGRLVCFRPLYTPYC